MTLEDHAGDVIRKARLHASVALEAAAEAAGLTPAELAELEETGQPKKPVNFETLADLLDLDGAKLEGITKGWLPDLPDLSIWRELRVLTTSDGGLAVNCYLIWDEATRDAAVFDTGWNARPILGLIDEHLLQLRHLFITHSHHDHIAAVAPLRERFPKLKLHSNAKSAPPDQRNRPSDFIHTGNLRVTHRETPGHSEDGVTYIVGNWPEDAPPVALVGDAIFAGSMGRGNQSGELARRKVRDQILSLPGDTLLCPGHGPLTTVAQEKAHNPFF